MSDFITATQRIIDRGATIHSADVASQSGTTETTLYRHIKSLEKLTETTIDASYKQATEYLAVSTFAESHDINPGDGLSATFSYMWDAPSEIAPAFSTIWWARLGRDRSNPREAAMPLERHVTGRCAQVLSADNQDRASFLASLLLNHTAISWPSRDILSTEQFLIGVQSFVGVANRLQPKQPDILQL